MKVPGTSVLELVQKLALHTQHHGCLHPKPSCPSAELGLPELAQALVLPGTGGGQAGHVPSPSVRGQGRNTHRGEPFPGEDRASP